MIVYLKGLKNSTKKFVDTINSFSKVPEYKNQSEKSVAFLYINDEQMEKEYRKIIPFKIAS
jgi:uncharacterized protein YlbG (UPF0298 family)